MNRCVQQRDETLSAWASHPVRPAPAKVGPVGAPVTNYGRALLERWRAQFWMTEPLYTIASLGVALSVAVAGLPVAGVDLAVRSSERLRTAPSGQRDRDQADDRLRCCLQRRADARPNPFTMPPTSAVDVPGPAHDPMIGASWASASTRTQSTRSRLPFPAFPGGARFLRSGLRASVQPHCVLRRGGVLFRAGNFSGGDFGRLLGRIELVRQLFQADEDVFVLLGQNTRSMRRFRTGVTINKLTRRSRPPARTDALIANARKAT